jgi:hypothetical protein
MKKLRIALAALALAMTVGCVTPPLVTDVRTERGQTVETKTRYLLGPLWWIPLSETEEAIDE